MFNKKISIFLYIFNFFLGSTLWCAHTSAAGAAAAAAVASAAADTPIVRKPVYVFFRLNPIEGNQFKHGQSFTAATTMDKVTPWILQATDLEGFSATLADLRVVEGVTLKAKTAEENKKIMDSWLQQPPLKTFTDHEPLYNIPSFLSDKKYGTQICVTLSAEAHARYLEAHKKEHTAKHAALKAAQAASSSRKADDSKDKAAEAAKRPRSGSSSTSSTRSSSASQSITDGTGKNDVSVAIELLAFGQLTEVGKFKSSDQIDAVLDSIRKAKKVAQTGATLEQSDLLLLDPQPDAKTLANFFHGTQSPSGKPINAHTVGRLPRTRLDRPVYLTLSEEGNKKLEVQIRDVSGSEELPPVNAAAAAASAAANSSSSSSSPASMLRTVTSLLRRGSSSTGTPAAPTQPEQQQTTQSSSLQSQTWPLTALQQPAKSREREQNALPKKII